ncbi:serine/threonine protein kinase [Olsenella umbonata]|uniref:non-specific serine/threonine protein kinase n=2 Tax=Parafannyhessea umbonata TaxID=604330 RepID=A0A7X9TAA1_9ACTN|nr:serine/threonine protein kinase [Parafannyhessea umbonata]
MKPGEAGGFGTVLTCWDTRLQRRVAIKRIPLMGQPGGAATSTISEALAEARTASMLAHPNIVTMYDFEVDRAYAYLVMEYVDGLTLADFLARVEGGTLTNDECAYLVQSVASALSFAHENRVLHLDIKPTNIMIEHSGAIKLCDFGMAMLASAAGYGGARGGTVGYMPPEQIEGDLVDERADIFSLAVVVWQALTGQNPFAAKTAEESLRKIERGPKVALSKMDPTLAGMAEEVIMQALDPNPTQRTPSAEAFANELVFGLGDPDLGAESIRELMSQDEKDVALRADEFKPEALPVAYRYPWLGSVAARAGAAALSAWAVYVALTASSLARSAGAAAVAAAGVGAAWPPAGSALALAAFAFSLFGVGATAASILLPLACVMAFLAWWIPVGTSERLSTCAVLLPCALGQPFGGAALAAFCLAPARAAATAGVGFVWQLAFGAARQAGFGADAVGAALVARLAQPGTWLLLAGSCLGALVASLLYRSGRLRSSVVSGVAGQVVGTAILITSQFMAARVENGGIWTSPKFADVAVAILLCVFVCIATNLRGPLDAGGEVEEIDELA